MKQMEQQNKDLKEGLETSSTLDKSIFTGLSALNLEMNDNIVINWTSWMFVKYFKEWGF